MQYDTDGNLDSLLVQYRKALDRLRSFGVRLPNSSRFCIYDKRMSSTLSQQGEELVLMGDQADQFLFDYREIDEVIFIVESFQTDPTDKELRKLQAIVGGSDNPDDDVTTLARDTQFELFLYTAFRKFGASAQLEEPDLLVSSKGVVFPVAAKRPTSIERLDDKLRRASSQIDRSNQLGVAAISLDQVIRPREKILRVTNRNSLGQSVKTQMDTFIAYNIRTILKRVQNKPLVAILFVLRTPARTQDTNLSMIGSIAGLAQLVAPGQPGIEIFYTLKDLVDKFNF